MSHDLISRVVRNVFEDHLVADSVLSEIDTEFSAAGIEYTEPNPCPSGARRARVRGFYTSLDWAKPGDVEKFLRVVGYFMSRQEGRVGHYGLKWAERLTRVREQLQKAGYDWRDGRFALSTANARLSDTKVLADHLDLPHLDDHIRRIEGSIATDPALAIGSAKEMIETVCKTILDKRLGRSVGYARDDDMNTLAKKTFAILKQLPDDIPDLAKGSKTIKTLLSNLRSVVSGIAELRNWYGSGHGQSGDTRSGMSPRHAKLVVGAAATLCLYLLETDRDTPHT